MSSLSISQQRLADSLRQLAANWNSAKSIWDDAIQREFEREFIAEFEATTSAGIEKLQELINTVNQAEREMS